MAKRALLSVSSKRGVVELARHLCTLGFEIMSTGGTAKALRDAGIAVTDVSDVTKFPEAFGGRMKTMHPAVLGGVLFRRGDAGQRAEAAKLGIEAIDLVVVNLYPFEETVADKSKKRDEIIEQIDIGGPTLLRSAAKNAESVTVVCDPADYERVLGELEARGETSPELRRLLAAKAFLHTAAYDAAITEYLSDGGNTGVMLTGGQTLRYGENPHQRGKYFGVYPTPEGHQGEPGRWGTQLQGKEMSYLNILDSDAAWTAVQEFEEPTAVLVKHTNPSGIASHADITEAFQRAYDADRLSAFGVIIAVNRECTEAIARKIIEQKIFVEVVVAPSFEEKVLPILREKENMRVIQQTNGRAHLQTQYRSVLDGMLLQNADTKVVTEGDLTVVTKKKPTPAQVRDLLFAWRAVKNTKSNAIVFAKDLVTVGIGGGQTSRVDATWIAAKRAGDKAKGAVMASDAFFPFPDSIEEAAKHGISAIIQPGGSVRDKEVFAKADELGLVMVTTGIRAFRH
jgi:phosphoribosylaminoimidazolecarboxamide formyltransferase/IMP cyclohydrolase